LELVRECQPDLILLDLLLPDQNGYEFITTLKNDPQAAHVPILVVSAMSEVQDRVKALELGADDFIVKSFERLEFEARTRRLLRLKRSLDQLNTRCDQALQQAATDSLTGLYTHGFMRETLAKELERAERYGHPYSTIFADIDHFKQVNDRFGHAAGDQVLRAVADALRGLMRQSDTLVRYGGEEFVALLPNTNGDDATVLAERMRTTVAALQLPIEGASTVRVTISLGVASFPDDARDGKSLVQLGDAAMYLAKRSGRNRTIACGSRPNPSFADVRVLVVNDEPRRLETLESHLRTEGCQLLHASNVVEAVEIGSQQQPDVIIVCTASPSQSGFDICRRLKQSSRTQRLPVLMVTAPASRDDRPRGLEAGADEFISEPIDKTELTTRVRALIDHKRDMDLSQDAEAVVFALASAVEDRDPLSAEHMQRVADYAIELGRALGLPPRELKALWRAGRVHDIGKIAIPDAILFKPGGLTPEELSIVREHSEKGYRLLLPLRTFGDALPAVRYHHERLDGSGYPSGLRGHNVPRLAQILAIADVFDALTARRHYRDALPENEAVAVLRQEASDGKHDPWLVETFVTQVVGRAGAGLESAGATADAPDDV
jgi:putative two-component system response regulator